MKKIISALVGALAVGAAVAAPAVATGTSSKVQIGTLAASAGPQQLTASSAGSVVWRFGTLNLLCSSSSLPTTTGSTVANSPTLNVLALMTINKLVFSGCSINGTQLRFTQVGSIAFHGVSGATNAATDVVAGHLDSLVIDVADAGTGGHVCGFRVSGKADGTYNEATKRLSVNETGSPSDLVLSNVVGCGGIVSNGQYANYNATYNIVIGGINNYPVNIKP